MALFRSTPGRWSQVSRSTPQQSALVQQLLSLLQGNAGQQGGLLAPFNFEPIAQGAMNRFNQQVVPTIGERFAGMDAQRSSGYSQAQANAARDLQLDLAGQEQRFNAMSQKNLTDLLGLGLQPQFENVYQEGKPGALSGMIPDLLGLAGHIAAAFGTGGASIPFSAAMYGGGGGNYEDLMNFFGRR
jgi:hypothetical protein